MTLGTPAGALIAGAGLAAGLLLSTSALHAQSRAAGLYAGAARVDITPDMPVGLAGYSDAENRISEGIHDRLYARALAFRSGPKKLVLVSCDLSGFAYSPVSYFQKEIFARFALQPGELVLCATHTHSAPMLILNKSYPHPNNALWAETVRAKLVEVVGKALSAAAPARLAAGMGQSPVAVNRRLPIPPGRKSPGGDRVTMGRNPDGPVDRDVLVLKIARRDGTPVASLFDYACHSRSLRSANKLVSGDIFGIAEQFVEHALGPNIVSPAFAGASGDIDPWDVVPTFDESNGRVPETVRMGASLGEEVVRVFRDASELPAPVELRTRWERLTLPGKVPGSAPPAAPVPARYIEMTAAALGDIAFLALDCEAFVEVGKAIKSRSPFRHTFILTNCNGGSGYLPPAQVYPEGGYEVGLTGFAPEAAGMVVEAAARMLSSLRN